MSNKKKALIIGGVVVALTGVAVTGILLANKNDANDTNVVETTTPDVEPNEFDVEI